MFDGSSEALALSVELRSSLQFRVDEVRGALSVVAVVTLASLLPVVLGIELGTVLPVEAGAVVPADISGPQSRHIC